MTKSETLKTTIFFALVFTTLLVLKHLGADFS